MVNLNTQVEPNDIVQPCLQDRDPIIYNPKYEKQIARVESVDEWNLVWLKFKDGTRWCVLMSEVILLLKA